MNSTVLITGGAGNLACQLSGMFEERGHRVVLIDIAEEPITPVGTDTVYMQVDITDANALDAAIASYRPRVILHFASLLSHSTEANRALGWKVNMDGGFALFEAALRHGVEQVFFPSSAAAYGGQLPDPVPQDLSQWPEGLYGVSKMAMERLGYYYHRKHGLDFRSIRLPIVVSPYAPAGAASAYASQVFISSLQNGQFTFQVRPQTSPSMIYVDDVLGAIIKLLDAANDQLTQRVYNIQAISPSAQELAAAVLKRIPNAHLDFALDPDITTLIESWPVRFDDTAARKDWGWCSHYDIDALADNMINKLTK